MTRPCVLIVGAGVGGLAAAWWLARAGWQPLVIEKAPDLRANGYMLGLSGPGYEIARRMGILPRLIERNRHIEENLYIGRDGRELLRLSYHEFLAGLDWITLARTDLVAELHRAAGEVAEIRFGTVLTELRNGPGGVDVRLSDGTEARVDLLIGADGIHSDIRARLFGAEANFAKPLGYRVAAFQAPDRLGLGRDFLSYAEPGRLVEFYTLAQDRMASLYIWRSTQTGFVAGSERREALRRAFAGAHPEALRWIDELPEEEPIFFDDVALIEMPQWSVDRCLLLGDAAHCLTLMSGQGAGIAMVSAYILADELAKGDVATALRRHERRLRPAVERLQSRSRSIAAWFIPVSARSFAIRNFLLRRMPRRILSWYFLRAVRSEILAANEDPARESQES